MKHPLHPAIVHFPVACWSLATLADVIGPFLVTPYWQLSGRLIAIGTLIATVAMAAGLAELPDLEPGSAPSRAARWHMVLAAIAWSCYAASLFLRIDGGVLVRPGPAAIALGVVGFISLCGAGWMGGKLVYEHGIGVRKQH